jgi:DNA helicase-2/ATP-dependent DNA helicase PcrA
LPAKSRSGLGIFLAAIEKGKAILEEPSGEVETQERRRNKSDPSTLAAGEGLSAFVVRIVSDAGLADYHQAQDEIAGTQRLANLQELANAASLYPLSAEGLVEFLEHIELDRAMERADAGDDTVTLITLHNTKGLEFRRVIMTGVEQGIFPREDKRDSELEEERRLFYVGATRAMDELYLSSCAQRRLFGRTQASEPSVFLREIPSGAISFVGKKPRSFEGSKPDSRRECSSDGLWCLGSRLFHDDYGYGVILAVNEGEEGPIVTASFETGKEVRFLPRYQAARFLRIGTDE